MEVLSFIAGVRFQSHYFSAIFPVFVLHIIRGALFLPSHFAGCINDPAAAWLAGRADCGLRSLVRRLGLLELHLGLLRWAIDTDTFINQRP